MNQVASYADSIWNPITEVEDLYDGTVNDEEYDLLVFIGRFQPFHLGHQRVVDIAVQKAKRVLILVGSSWRPRRPRNPWTFEERRAMIRATYNVTVPESKLIIEPLGDFTYRDEVWISEVQSAARAACKKRNAKIGLIGCSKDASSYYLKLFPRWGNVNVRFLNPLNATDIRNNVFRHAEIPEAWSRTSDPRLDLSNQMTVINPMVRLIIEHHIKAEKSFPAVRDYFLETQRINHARQEGQQFPVQELCADALVTQSGHVLLQQRGSKIGYGLWALPGGYVNPDETLLEAAIRELREEVKLKVPEPVLRGSLVDTFDADDPHRSERGRLFSKVHHFRLADQTSLPEIRPGSLVEDGRKEVLDVRWVPFSEITTDNMFEDHADIVMKMLNI